MYLILHVLIERVGNAGVGRKRIGGCGLSITSGLNCIARTARLVVEPWWLAVHLLCRSIVFGPALVHCLLLTEVVCVLQFSPLVSGERRRVCPR